MIPIIEKLTQDFEFIDNWEDRYRYIIDLGKNLPHMPEEMRINDNKVSGCVSQVWLVSEHHIDEQGNHVLHLSGDSDAHIVRGLISILLSILSNHSPGEILATDIHGLFAHIGLENNLSLQRSNGLNSMIAQIRCHAQIALDDQSMRELLLSRT